MDMERVALLLSITNQLHGYPAYANILKEAMAELKDINEGIVDKPGMPEPEPVMAGQPPLGETPAPAPIEPRNIRHIEESTVEHVGRR